MKENVLKSFLSAVVFAICYALITFVFEHKVDVAEAIIGAVMYFIMMCLLYVIAPKIRKVTGHDKKGNE